MIEPVLIASDCVSLAWTKAFKTALQREPIPPMLIQISTPKGKINECDEIRILLDRSLEDYGLSPVMTVANTILPVSLWNPNRPRQELYERYGAIWPQVKRSRSNRNGVYFQRLIAFPDFGPGEKNQLEYIITTYLGGNHRNSALQASIYAPTIDATNQRQRGFPCLQQVAFGVEDDGVTVTGFYPTQYLFEKAYGNYLGLCQLGTFMAHEIGASLAGIRCFVNHPVAGKPRKGDLRNLEREILDIADRHEAHNV
jgi:hypothetical protein